MSETRILHANSVFGDVTDGEFRFRRAAQSWTAAIAITGGWQTLDSGVQIMFVPAAAGQDFFADDTWNVNVEANITGLDEGIIGMSYDEFVETYCLPVPVTTTTTTT